MQPEGNDTPVGLTLAMRLAAKTDAELKRLLRLDVRDARCHEAAAELDRRERIWRLYEAAIEPAPGVVHTASTRLARSSCLLCGEKIRVGQTYCDGRAWAGQALRAHYECVPGLGVDREPWMSEREKWLEEAKARGAL